MKYTMFVLIVIFSCIKVGYTYDWPTPPFSRQDSIWGTMGEMRDSSGIPHHFHNGVDIRDPIGDTVYSVVDHGLVHSISSGGLWIDDYQYYHVTALPSISDSDTVLLHQAIATIFELNHVHFREKSTSSTPYNAVNPLRDSGFTSYVDSTNPYIDSIRFYRQGDTLLLSSNSLDGRIDVLAVAGDTRTDTVGHSPSDTGNVSVHRIGYAVHATLGNRVKDYWEGITFDSIPGGYTIQQLNLTYGSGSNDSTFRYWVTNDPFNSNSTLRNWYWNTKQDSASADAIDADSIEVAKFKDGFYWVKVFAYDIAGNADSESVYVHVDNFNPRVKESRPNDWFAFVPTKEKRIWCRFSEAMDRRQEIRISGLTLRCRRDSLETRLRLETCFAEGKEGLEDKHIRVSGKIREFNLEVQRFGRNGYNRWQEVEALWVHDTSTCPRRSGI